MPTNAQIEKAKTYLRKRLNAEQSMARNLEEELAIFANKLLKLFKEFGINDPYAPYAKYNQDLQDRIKKLLQALIDALIDDVELLSLASDDSDRDFLLPLIHGEVYGMTLDSRVRKWCEDYKDNLLLGFHNNGMSAIDVSTNVGAGAGLKRLLKHTVAIAWMQGLLHNNSNATGFYSYRGSTYPCATCDDMVGYHPIREYPLGGWHVNCVCLFVLV